MADRRFLTTARPQERLTTFCARGLVCAATIGFRLCGTRANASAISSRTRI
jgi:hypothetical protein